ncbi:MAG: TPM domain-containing protein [Clostridiales bacterium]|nr:TPM domain-containing protein [Clostridiales bacterium]
MRKRLLAVIAALVLSLSLFVPAYAVSEYGLIYDETELLYSDELDSIGTVTMQDFVEKYDVDLRVDVLTTIGSFNDVEETAEYLYEEYEYGGIDGNNGVSLTLLVHEDTDGVALDEWCLHFGGDNSFWTTNAPWNVNDVYDIMTEDNWSGDINQDIQTLTYAIEAMIDGVELFIVNGGMNENVYDEPDESVVVPSNVTDYADLLTDSEQQILENKAQEIADTYGVGAYIVTVNDYRDYTDGSIYDASDFFYLENELGEGNDGDGIMLLLSMTDRDYNLIAYGDYAQYVFNDGGMYYLEDFFLDDFRNDDWYEGFYDYLTWCDNYIVQAENGEAYSYDFVPAGSAGDTDYEEESGDIMTSIAIILFLPLIVAGIYIFTLVRKMKSVEAAFEASEYMTGRINLIEEHDIFTHQTKTRRKIEKESSSSSGGSKKSRSGRSSGGGRGRSGKF